MSEYNLRWTAFGVRKHLCIRWWWNGNPLLSLYRWLRGRAYRWAVEAWANTRPRDQDVCYCPSGCTTTFRLEFFCIGCWGWLSRDWTKRPCCCDRVIEQLRAL